MRQHLIKACALALIAGAVGFIQAADKPNFTGTWKLNTAKSDFGSMPAPDSRTDKITHADPALTNAFSQSGQMGDVSAEIKYSTDGKETTNVVRGNELKSTAKWEGSELVVVSKASFNGSEITLNDRWSLSDDGKTLTVKRHVNSPMGETDQKIVSEKQ
ncbi:MAG: hypothetical protein ABSH50_11930 [Bryobacteraceae bacterium]